MKTKRPIICIALLFCVLSFTAFGQHTRNHTVHFNDIDGFSGYVKFTTKYTGFATQLSADNGTLVLKKYDTDSESLAVLKKAGYDLYGYPESGVTPNENYGYEVTGNAYVSTHGALREAPVSKLHINRNLGEKMVTPDFPKDVVDAVKKDNLWEKTGGFRNERVITLYISEFKNEIQRIRYAAKKEREQKEKEEQAQKEAEEKEKAENEKAEQENQEDEAKEAEKATTESAVSSDNPEKAGTRDKEEEADSKETNRNTKKQTVYSPKTNRQLYDELKALTDATPALLNDPKIRAQLRNYKAFADRDDRNVRDYNTLERTMGGGYHPDKITAMNSIYQTNANIANAEMGVGAAVDAATGLVNSIVEANNRKNEARLAEEQNKRNAANAKKKAIAEWETKIREQREAYERETVDKIKQDFTLVATIGDEPITYETEEYKEGKTYWKGQTMITPREFVKKTATMKNTWGNGDKTYNLYIVEMNGLYGILGDDGEALYPPQFEGIYILEDPGARPQFLVNINDKWGEILANGAIEEEIQYEGIWYTADKKSKILKKGDALTIISLDDYTKVETLNTIQINATYPAGLIPVLNVTNKGYNKTGNYSLAANGKLYVWGESNEEGVESIPYESVKISQTTERMFKLDDKWYISMGFGTKSMKVDAMPRKFVVPTLREVETAQGKQRKWGAINEQGETVIPFTYSYMAMEKQGITTNNGDFFGPQYQTKWLTENNLYYDNGQLKASRWFNEEDNVEGEVLMYHENGNLSARLHYVNGLLDGEKQQAYREDGTLHAVEDWKDDVREGKATYYFRSGEIGREGRYEKDKKQGEWTTYYDTGAVYKRGRYKNDLETGEWKIYNEDGTPQTTITYENGGITNIIEH